MTCAHSRGASGPIEIPSECGTPSILITLEEARAEIVLTQRFIEDDRGDLGGIHRVLNSFASKWINLPGGVTDH